MSCPYKKELGFTTHWEGFQEGKATFARTKEIFEIT